MPRITRQEYMQSKDPLAYNKYYGQYVSENYIKYVVSTIGRSRLLNSTNVHFNDISLVYWDSLRLPYNIFSLADRLGDTVTQSTVVCVAKEAARQFVAKERSS